VETCNPASGCVAGTALVCNDGNACNGVETCAPASGCVAGTALVCNDNNACTTDSCVPATGCAFAAIVCNDGIACTTDSCNPATGCVATANNGACADGNACTQDVCTVGVGCSNPAVNCNDGNLCTTDSCNPATGCVATPIVCNDSNICTDDACNPANGQCAFTNNAAPCDDGDFCTINDTCAGGTCADTDPNPDCENAICEVFGPANTEVACPISLARATLGTPLPAGVQFNVQFNGTQLEALRYTDFITIPGVGTIEAQVPPQTLSTGHSVTNFPASLPAWNDNPGLPNSKNPATGSTLMANLSDPTSAVSPAYVDGLNIVQGDPLVMTLYVRTLQNIPASAPQIIALKDIIATTAAAEPMAGVVQDFVIIVSSDAECATDLECDDGDPCTADTCNVANGLCISAPLSGASCDDGDACTAADSCVAGSCIGTPVTCTDNNTCTTDSCNPATGACVFAPLSGQSCNDGNGCTSGDTCQNGVCTGAPTVCNDANPCTDDSCTGGACVFTFNAAPCNDGNACSTGDVCNNGACAAGTLTTCPDSNICDGTDVCNPVTGACQPDFTNLPFCGDGILTPQCQEECDDNNQNPFDGCSPTCKIEPCVTAADCNDNNPCTNDVCNLGIGCANPPNNNPCNDGNACTINDTCGAGSCQPGIAAVCSDGINCTTNSCNPATGCVFTENDALCNDGEPCTTDVCDAASGCQNIAAANGTACNDGNACTQGEQCSNGICGSSAPVNCDDNNVCTSQSCNPLTGCQYNNLSGVVCDDGDECSLNDQCQAGVCQPGAVTNPECKEEFPVCALTGNAGQQLDCAFNIARAAQAQDNATGLQFTMRFDRTVLNLVNFYDLQCFGPVGCFDVPVIGGQPLSTGHSISIAPTTINSWNGTNCTSNAQCSALPAPATGQCIANKCEGTGGFGGVVIVNLTNPGAALSNAYLQAGAVVNDPLFVKVRFNIIAAAVNQQVLVGSLAAAQKDSLPLNVTVQTVGGNSVLVTQP
jgi:cysteine-rich repeat protein